MSSSMPTHKRATATVASNTRRTTGRCSRCWGHQTNARCLATQFGARVSPCGIPILDRSSKSDIGQEWTTFRAKADRRYGHAGKLQKNALHIGASLAFASEAGKRSANLEQLCQAILDVDNSVPENGA